MAELSFRIPELSTGNGVKAVTAQVRQINGVSGVEIDLHTKWVVVTGERIEIEAIRDAIRQAGYAAEF